MTLMVNFTLYLLFAILNNGSEAMYWLASLSRQ